MRRALRLLVAALLFAAVLFAFLFWLSFFSARPPLATDPETLAGDGSLVNYCASTELDDSGKNAIDIPKGNTPGCRYDHFPAPILADCTEPLAQGADDIRGLWVAVEGGVNPKLGHVERIEQCGSRTVVTAAGIIHDYGPNATAGLNTDDTEGAVLFTIGDKEYCNRTSASMIWRDGKLDFDAFGWGPVVTQRYLDGDQLVWEYLDGSVTRMERACTLPQEHKTPTPRGPRYAF